MHIDVMYIENKSHTVLLQSDFVCCFISALHYKHVMCLIFFFFFLTPPVSDILAASRVCLAVTDRRQTHPTDVKVIWG